eukprot:TRINITY_DN30994_c0_g1_i1.p1 TRINITY_DN30994_c0_g1~~TRINITY_DN30994_c0_g1_i1.p1  ORF type:complete len:333 (+),score=77.38 TRINITY_DN30994_c0_g1_i1:2-1000(+)
MRACAAVPPANPTVTNSVKSMAKAARDGGRSKPHVQAEVLLKRSKAVASAIVKYVEHEHEELERGGATQPQKVLAAPAAMMEKLVRKLAQARQALRAANRKAKRLKVEQAEAKRKAAGLTGPPPSDVEWLCDSDPGQRGKIKAVVGGETCDSMVNFRTASGPLNGNCKQQFAADSAELYGKAQLHLAKILEACASFEPLDAAIAKKSKATELSAKAAQEQKHKISAEQAQKLRATARVQEKEGKRMKGLADSARKAFELSEKDRERAQEVKNKAIEEREQAQRRMENAVAKGCLLYTSDAADEEDSVDLGGRRIIKKKNKGGPLNSVVWTKK